MITTPALPRRSSRPGFASRAVALAAAVLAVSSPLALAADGHDELDSNGSNRHIDRDRTGDNIGHERHHIHTNDPHPRVQADATRFFTTRDGRTIELPTEADAFSFVVFGDRTGGPDEGVGVLADAVHDTNLLEPDLVMTVGDLVQGYNTTEPWMEQMREFRGIMNELLCPWFPVAGNHDVYWRGPGKPTGEHEASYEMHFGPLWYAFEHKNSMFIALYSDEGNPETGEKNFNKPESQRMSEEQFEFLRQALDRAKGKDHVFLFLHHPRWLGNNYGDDWERVHNLLKSAGNVRAVFAGHIHRMRHDGIRDGIEYVTLATVGGHQNGTVPQAGYLHHFHVVTVRKGQIAIASIPVGEVMNVRAITGQVSDETAMLAGVEPLIDGALAVSGDGSVDSTFTLTMSNPSSRPVELTLVPQSRDSRWFFSPDHTHGVVAAGGTSSFTFRVERMASPIDRAFWPFEVQLETDYLAEGYRYTIPAKHVDVPLDVELPLPPVPTAEMALRLDGEDDALRVPGSMFELPDGPMTVEAWMRAERFGNRVGLVCKTEGSEFGLFVSRGTPEFSIHLDGKYATAEAERAVLEPGRWHHVAGVFDGSEVRVYVDGGLVAAASGSGHRTPNQLPLIIGGDVDGRGRPTSHFDGMVDAVRVSRVARYAGQSFRPQRRFEPDSDTVLLYNMDGTVGPWLVDASASRANVAPRGGASVVPAKD